MTTSRESSENRSGTADSVPGAESATPAPDFGADAAVYDSPEIHPLSAVLGEAPAPDEPETPDAPEEPSPDVGFSLSAEEPDVPTRARRLAHRIAAELQELGPEGWSRVRAVFALAGPGQRSQIRYSDDDQRQALIAPTETLMSLVVSHRRLSAELGDPWWRLELELTAEGALNVDHDYGDDPFPDDQLFSPQEYLADLESFPRDSLPTWLAAYIGHENRQVRTPRQAAEQARADRESGYLPVVSEDDFPAFPLLWSRWAAIAAAFVAVGSEWGPRVLPSFGWFEGSRRSGSSLYELPGGRAVLSGGVWNAPELEAAYNGKAPLPRLYAGAPEWVANPVLNTRAGGGLLSFCYWWERGRWYRGESPSAADVAVAVPGIWTAATVTDVICDLLAEHPSAELRSAVASFVDAAQRRDVTHAHLEEVFGDAADLDAVHYQLALAGVARLGPEPIPASEALEIVRHHLRTESADTTAFPPDQLRADRLSVGWLVYLPVEPDEIVLDRALFYVADDGVVEATTSSMPASAYLPGLEQRFRQRHS
ncbi:hypothetical protein [Nocardia concava]|uniref:hypothetical protein n=1 Tax=Nocardia concava TaxID=257281 RepID=UPI0002F39F11|nr:hypothetical protein [Nocardia concava]